MEVTLPTRNTYKSHILKRTVYRETLDKNMAQLKQS